MKDIIKAEQRYKEMRDDAPSDLKSPMNTILKHLSLANTEIIESEGKFNG
ncbi:hypothetical protein [Leptospira noguchii]|nr:hypothetical protein [Leptospira noguchii]